MKKIPAIIGSLLLIIGCFLPIMNMGDKTLTLFDTVPANIPDVPQNAMIFTAIAIILISLLTLSLALMNKTKFLWLSGILTGIILACLYYGFHTKLKEIKDETNKQLDDLFGGMFKGIANSMFDAVTIGGSGWYVIGSGALMFIIASLLPIKQTKL